jgi:hypothetical protein
MKFKRKLGFQAISDNMTVLKELAAGSHYLAVGLVFRDAVLKSKLLLNSEVWHGLQWNAKTTSISLAYTKP